MKHFLKLKQVYKCLENAEVGLDFSVKSIKARKYTLNIARHDICQKFHTTGVFRAKILPKKGRASRQKLICDKIA